jgi:hypothetical protein
MIARAPAHLGNERVLRRARVQLGDQRNGRSETGGLAPHVERLVADILVGVPDPAPVLLRHAGQQPGGAVGEPERRQPALRHQAVGLRNRRLEALQHRRARRIAADSQAVDARFQTLELERLRRARGAVHHPVHEIAQFRRAGFLPRLERASEPLVGINPFPHLTCYH